MYVFSISYLYNNGAYCWCNEVLACRNSSCFDSRRYFLFILSFGNVCCFRWWTVLYSHYHGIHPRRLSEEPLKLSQLCVIFNVNLFSFYVLCLERLHTHSIQQCRQVVLVVLVNCASQEHTAMLVCVIRLYNLSLFHQTMQVLDFLIGTGLGALNFDRSYSFVRFNMCPLPSRHIWYHFRCFFGGSLGVVN